MNAKALQDDQKSLGLTPSLAKSEMKKEVWRQIARFHSGAIHVGGVQERSHCDLAGGTAPRVRAAKSSEFIEIKL